MPCVSLSSIYSAVSLLDVILVNGFYSPSSPLFFPLLCLSSNYFYYSLFSSPFSSSSFSSFLPSLIDQISPILVPLIFMYFLTIFTFISYFPSLLCVSFDYQPLPPPYPCFLPVSFCPYSIFPSSTLLFSSCSCLPFVSFFVLSPVVMLFFLCAP